MLGLGNGLEYQNSNFFSKYWDPTFISPGAGELSIWLKFDTGHTSSLGAVSAWKDASGNSNHATQAAAGDQATQKEVGSTGKYGLDFEAGEGDHYDFASAVEIAEEEGFIIFLVCEVESVSANMTILGLNAVTHFLEFKAGGDNIRIRLGSTTTDIAPDDTNQFHSAAGKFLVTIIREKGDPGNLVLYRDGNVLAQSSQATNSGDGEFATLGVRNADRFFDGVVYEFLMYENIRDWNDIEIANMHSYLMQIHDIAH